MFSRLFGGQSSAPSTSNKDNKNKSKSKSKSKNINIDEDIDDEFHETSADDLDERRDSLASDDGKEAKQGKEGGNQDNPLLPEELCEIPTFLNTACCDTELIEETRKLLKAKFEKRPESFSDVDYDRMMADDWTVSRFLLRCRLDPKRSAKLMEQCGKFRREYKMGTSKMSDFPIEFHRAGGLFRYAPDRVGNQTIYMRIKMHRRIPELTNIMKGFILCCLEECDRANNGRGTAVIFDLSQCGIQNADPGFLFWLVYSFRNYCPKGLSYIIVYNLPWMLNATAKLALSWLSSNNRRRLRFVSGEKIQDFIAPENLPDYMGGTCKLGYRQVPKGSRHCEDTAEEHNLTREQARKIKEMYAKFLNDVDSDIKIDEATDNEKIDTTMTTKPAPDSSDSVSSTKTGAQDAVGLITSSILAS